MQQSFGMFLSSSRSMLNYVQEPDSDQSAQKEHCIKIVTIAVNHKIIKVNTCDHHILRPDVVN